jgi:ferredoxin
MRVRVDSSKCQGHGRCAVFAPDVFILDEEGFAAAIDGTVPSEHEEACRTAILNCPEQAIDLAEQ